MKVSDTAVKDKLTAGTAPLLNVPSQRRPGFIYTEMHADGGEPRRVDRVASTIPMRRGGQPEEIARVIGWLISDDASYVTGTFTDAAGGR